ncbi:MAG: TIGR03960 family B12-binding radical SAM protein [Pirellulales bacterium]|nr:TIGR03960 family B12-binding radical SAM protein [Pirellulales bacterium]
MLNQELKDKITALLLPDIRMPAQYVGGELNSRAKDHAHVRGTLCLAFPDTYSIGMSNVGLQVLYDIMNRRDDWACERVFAPWVDMEELLRKHELPLYGLETFTPLDQFDVLGFTLQYDMGYTNVLTMLDLGRVPLHCEERTLQHPLVIAGGPCAFNPEPMTRFIDVFVVGDGEEVLPRLCDEWLRAKEGATDRREALTELARRVPNIYVPIFYQPASDCGSAAMRPTLAGLPETIEPAVVEDLDALPMPTAPLVPYVECVQERISIEIMRGCPWRCRFCQSSTIKRPLRFRRVETLLEAARKAYRNTGFNEISLLSLSTSDYPYLQELVESLRKEFEPLGVSISVPSLRVNEQLQAMGSLLDTQRRGGLTIAPEAALDDMRQQIGKRISNHDLYEGCEKLFAAGFNRVKLYFMCGLPGERREDLEGIVEMAETISELGRKVRGRPIKVVANVSNFVPKPQTPYQWNAMRTRNYFREAHSLLRKLVKMRSVSIKCHDVECSLLEGAVSRGGREVGAAIENAWRAGARFDSWSERLVSDVWWQAFADAGVDVQRIMHQPYQPDAALPWGHIGIRQGAEYLRREQEESVVQLGRMEGGEG